MMAPKQDRESAAGLPVFMIKPVRNKGAFRSSEPLEHKPHSHMREAI